MSKRLVTAEEMRRLDAHAIRKLGIPGMVLMENAARSACEVIEEYFGSEECACCGIADLPVLVVCGKGNNGGDGLAIARLLANRDADVAVLLLGRARDLKGDAKTNYGILCHGDVEIIEVTSERRLEQFFAARPEPEVIVDAIFGTGFKGKPSGIQAAAISQINACASFVLAIDIPSGVGADDGRVEGCAVTADATVTMALLKRGLALYPGKDYCGDVWTGDIGIPQSALRSPQSAATWLLDSEDVEQIMPFRPSAGHKGTFGTALFVAGSRGFTGAARLASLAALRIGCGLSKLCVPISVLNAVEAGLAEVVKFGVYDTPAGALSAKALPQIADILKTAQVLAIGPGIGTLPETRELQFELLKRARVPVVIDADGVSNLAGQTRLLKTLKVPAVLTPHPGELSRLLNLSPAGINADRIEVCRRAAREFGAFLVLKGAPTVVGSPDGRVFVNSTGNSGLASGGTGDVLTGVIAGLIAQGVPPFEAAQAGVFLHGQAADLALEEKTEYGLIAGDLLDYLPDAIKSLNCDCQES
jgi:ADP-dependent NAD(P)H-hydrate dehydratase / NAD(P)H-hydrate epimerase